MWKQSPAGKAWIERVTARNRKMAQDPEWRRKVGEAAIKRASDPRWKEKQVGGYGHKSYEEKMRKAFAKKLIKLNRDYKARQGIQESYSNGTYL